MGCQRLHHLYPQPTLWWFCSCLLSTIYSYNLLTKPFKHHVLGYNHICMPNWSHHCRVDHCSLSIPRCFMHGINCWASWRSYPKMIPSWCHRAVIPIFYTPKKMPSLVGDQYDGTMAPTMAPGDDLHRTLPWKLRSEACSALERGQRSRMVGSYSRGDYPNARFNDGGSAEIINITL